MRLTPQQQAVVNHNYGPALVFKLMARLAEEWGAFGQGGVAQGDAPALNVDVVKELAQPKPRPSMSATSAPSPTAGKARGWETFDEIAHPDFGRGIIISTTTTTRGRELKVQFVDGNLKHFRDDDPALARG